MPVSNQKEEIDERILRLLGLDDVFDLDYDTYLTLLKEAMIKGRMVNKTIPTEELMLLGDEYKRVKNEKEQGRFKVNKKKISVSSFSIGDIKKKITAVGPTRGLLGAAETIAKAPIQKGLDDNITSITTAVVSISETLKRQNKLFDDASAYNKRKEEQEKRGLAESKLEKRFDGLKKLAEKIIAPVKSLLDRILEFFTTVILGRIVYKLIEWLGNPENANKVKSIIRFLGDWGPALLGGFILFGTKFGKGVRILTSIALSGIAKLAKAIPALLRFAKSNPRTAAAVAVGGYAATQLAQRAFSGEEQKVEQRAGGGSISVPRFSGGGFNLSGMLGGFRNYFSGLVTGEKGVDKIPAWLSDGEFVISAGAVRKYGVETFEAMNAAGGGTNRPTFKNESVYAAGGGYMGDYMSGQVKLRPATTFEMTGESSTLRNLLGVRTKEEAARIVSSAGNKVPDVKDLLGSKEFLRFEQGAINKFSEGADEKTFKGLRRIYQQHFGVGEEFSKMMSARFDAEMLRRTVRPTSTPKPKVTRIDPTRMLPAAGESSANAMRAAAKAAQNVRQPIPASRAIVPYTGGGLVRSGVTAGLSVPEIQQIRTNMNVPGGRAIVPYTGGGLVRSGVTAGLSVPEIQQIRTNMNVPGGRSGGRMGGPLAALFAALDFVGRKQEGQTNAQAALGAAGGAAGGQLGFMAGAKAGALIGGGIGAMFAGVGAAPGAAIGGIIGGIAGGFGGASLGGKLADDVSGVNAAKERLGRGGIGGKIMGGYGLKEQSFKDAPKTQVMSDDKGKPFIGYKAMRNGKIVYVRGPQPGTGTSNPLEALGRMINPGAYKDVDAASERRKYQEASAGSISSLKARGATQATIAKRQAELNKRKPVKPPTKTKPKVVVAGGGMNGRRGSGSRPSTPNVPNFSASNKSRSKINILGITI